MSNNLDDLQVNFKVNCKHKTMLFCGLPSMLYNCAVTMCMI